MVIDLIHNIYFSQAKHGAFLTGQTDLDEGAGFKLAEKWRSCAEIARKFVKLMPRLKDINIVRQWAGLYEVTPDRQPIISPCPGFDNFLVGAGFSGHGFMLSPIAGRLLSEIVIHGKAVTVDISDYSVERFKSKTYTIEANVV
jgi:sarcosine oxidase subunit beta